jgi:hypothetical protein
MSPIEKPFPNKTNNSSTSIYINTLTPYFQFKNKLGSIVKPMKQCIAV